MTTTTFTKLVATEPSDPDKTIETLAEELKQEIITQYYAYNPDRRPNENHDRIVLTAGVVIDDN